MFESILSLETRKKLRKPIDQWRFRKVYQRYQSFTMIPEKAFLDNLELCWQHRFRKGCIVECGVWKGGMSAAITQLVGPDRNVFLFDSFEGLPQASELDGAAAIAYQQDTSAPDYFDNCKADIDFAREAMKLAGAGKVQFVKGWFSDTLPGFTFPEEIAILRLDGDWYDSTMQCLENLYDKVAPGGLILIDDYFYWDGCTRAVHDFLSRRNLPARIRESRNGVCYIYKY